MARYDDLNTSAIAYATFISAIVLLVVILLVQALTFSWLQGEDERKLANTHYHSADAEIAKQKAKLEGYTQEMVDVAPPAAQPGAEPVAPTKEKRLHIPVKQAQSLILNEFKKPASANAGT